MNLPLLLMNVQVYSTDKYIRCLTSKEAILNCDEDIEIKIPCTTTKSISSKLVVGEQYYIRYVDGIGEYYAPPEFRYVGMINKQLVFSSLSSHAA